MTRWIGLTAALALVSCALFATSYPTLAPASATPLPTNTAVASVAPSPRVQTGRRPVSTVNINIDPAKRAQRIDGFGAGLTTSGSPGRASLYTQLSPERRQALADLLWRDLGATLVRLQIYDGLEAQNDDGDPNHLNWSRFDLNAGPAGEIQAIQDALAHGVTTTIAVCFSPPVWMKDNHNLRGGHITQPQEFAEFLAAYVLGMQQQHAIRIDNLALLNEPTVPLAHSTATTPQELRDLLRVVGKRFRELGLTTRLAAPDTGNVNAALDYAKIVLADSDARSYVALLSTHDYRSQQGTAGQGSIPWRELPMAPWADFAALAAQYNLPTWQTEMVGNVTPQGVPAEPIEAALFTATLIHQALTQGNASAWMQWEYFWEDDVGGLAQIRGDGFRLNKNYWALWHWSRFVPPGSVRIGAESSDPALLVSAYAVSDQQTIIVAINPTSETKSARFALPGLSGSVAHYATTAVEDGARRPDLTPEADIFRATLEAASIHTFIAQVPTAAAPNTLSVDLNTNLGRIQPFNALQGGPKPLPTNTSDADLTERFRAAGVDLVRFPQDDGFDYTLAGIFPDASRSPDDPSAYRFEKIDAYAQAIKAAGAEPLWEATYDIGSGDRWIGCCQAGRPPRHLKKWASVIEHVLMHWNEGWANGYRWNVRYVEFINEPFGLGGFRRDQPQWAWEAYAALTDVVREYNARYGQSVKVVGYANPILASRLTEDLSLLDGFLNYIRTNNVPLDIFSYHNYDAPADQLRVAQAIRQRLDAAGYSQVPLWNSEWNMWEANIPAEVRGNESLHSAYIAAHNAQTKMLLQGIWNNAITYRANRPGAKGTGHQSYEYMYFFADGRPKPAYFGWLIFKQMADETPLRLESTFPTETGLTMLAGKSADGARLNVLLSAWSSQSQTYRLQIRGLVPGTRYAFERYVVDQSTAALSPVQSGEIASNASGEAEWVSTLGAYALEFWKLRR